MCGKLKWGEGVVVLIVFVDTEDALYRDQLFAHELFEILHG